MKIIKKDDMEFINIIDKKININFSTAYNEISYKKDTIDGIKNIEKLKNVFNLKDVYFINQIHSDIVVNGNEFTPTGEKDGDSIIFKGKNIAVGVFTADCVPIVIYDKNKEVIAAIHSGWKGTYDEITKKTCEYMKEHLDCDNLKMIIGPHIKKCCYEVSEELAEKFRAKFGLSVTSGRILDLEECIKVQVKNIVKKEDIQTLGICTNCESKIELHSYRRDKEQAGRLFSLIFIKE